jgi:hypothetical protein
VGRTTLASQTCRPHAFRAIGKRQSFRCSQCTLFDIFTWGHPIAITSASVFALGISLEESSMRIAIAALLVIIALTLAACVHETTMFHSFNGAEYFRGDPVVPSATSQSSAGEPVPSR